MDDQGRRRVPWRPPPAVIAAVGLLVLTAVAFIVDGVIGLTYAGPVTDAFRRAYAGVEGAEFTIWSIRATAIVLLVVAAGLLTLAWFDLRGSGFARHQTWVLGVLVVCWGGFSLFSEPRQPRRVPDPDELERLLAEAMPGWVDHVNTVTTVVSVGAVLTAMVLLMTGPARRFYRREPDPVDDPLPRL